MAASDSGLTHSRLFYINPDYASCWTLLPRSALNLLHALIVPITTDNSSFQAVNNTNIATYSVHSITHNLSLQRSFPCIADVQMPIFGSDFLQKFGLKVDVRQHHISDSVTHLKIQGVLTTISSSHISHCPKDCDDPYLTLLAVFQAVTQATTSD